MFFILIILIMAWVLIVSRSFSSFSELLSPRNRWIILTILNFVFVSEPGGIGERVILNVGESFFAFWHKHIA